MSNNGRHRLLCGSRHGGSALWLYTQDSEPHWTDTVMQWTALGYITASGFLAARRRYLFGGTMAATGVALLYLAKHDVIVYHKEYVPNGCSYWPPLVLSADAKMRYYREYPESFTKVASDPDA